MSIIVFFCRSNVVFSLIRRSVIFFETRFFMIKCCFNILGLGLFFVLNILFIESL